MEKPIDIMISAGTMIQHLQAKKTGPEDTATVSEVCFKIPFKKYFPE